MYGAEKSDCHTLKLSWATYGNTPTAVMPADARPHSILCVKSLRKLAFAFGLCRLVNKCWAFIAEFQPSILPAPDLRTGRGFV
jgi:hypothetical protein